MCPEAQTRMQWPSPRLQLLHVQCHDRGISVRANHQMGGGENGVETPVSGEGHLGEKRPGELNDQRAKDHRVRPSL